MPCRSMDMGGGVFDQSFALPQISPQGGDLGLGAETARAAGRKNAAVAAIRRR